MDVVLDPQTLLISQEDWENEELRDEWQQNLLDILDYIDDFEDMFILWNEDYDYLLWSKPGIHPWTHSNDYRINWINILKNKLNKNQKNIQDALIYDPCKSGTDFKIPQEALQMMHYCIDEDISVYFLTKACNHDASSFSCEHGKISHPHVVTNYHQFWDKDAIIEDLWPQTSSQGYKLNQIINLYLSSMVDPSKFLYKYSFSLSFIKSVIPYKSFGYEIIKQLTKRLQLTQAEAQADGSLHDEYIEGIEERRMRVTPRPSSTRIHYIFENNQIVFRQFYGPGEHDKGL